MTTETFTKSLSNTLAVAMVAAAVLATSLVSDAQAFSEVGERASSSASSSGGDTWGSDREQRMANGPISKRPCKSNAYDRADAQAFCAGKLNKPKAQVVCRGGVRRWICR